MNDISTDDAIEQASGWLQIAETRYAARAAPLPFDAATIASAYAQLAAVLYIRDRDIRDQERIARWRAEDLERLAADRRADEESFVSRHVELARQIDEVRRAELDMVFDKARETSE